jgi:hypothetical protein
LKEKEVVSIKLDPFRETADIDEKNNSWPLTSTPSTFELFKSRKSTPRGSVGGKNPMQKEIKN